MEEIMLDAHAKVNLTLDIVGKRSDNYHLLRSVMQSISLADRVYLTKQSSQISVEIDNPQLPSNQDNIAWRAAEHFFNHIGLSGGVDIRITKNIPVAAGLGGGTADGAAVLVGLNKLYNTELSLSELSAIGGKVGADMPFCITGGTRLIEGIGEQVTALPPLPDVVFVLVALAESVSTAEVYGGLLPTAFGSDYSYNFVRALTDGASLFELTNHLGNALETVTMSHLPSINLWKERLSQAGAVGTLMSGSGPTIFGIFNAGNKAKKFVESWDKSARIILARPVSSGVRHVIGGTQ